MEKDCDEHARGERALIFQKEPGIKGSMYEKTEGPIDAWLDEGREERKREKKKGSISEVNQIKHRPQKLLKKGIKINHHCSKIDPKSFQKEAKTDQKSEQRLQDDLGDFPANGRGPGAILGAEIEPHS